MGGSAVSHGSLQVVFMANRSSFLQLFDNERIGAAYAGITEEHRDLRAALLVVLDVLKQVAKESMSAAFARQDLLLMREYFRSRKAATLATCAGDRFGFFHVCDRLGLNHAEEALFFLAVCSRVLDIPVSVWNALKELRGTDGQNPEGALWLYRRVSELLEETETSVREEIFSLLLSAEQPRGAFGLRRALVSVMRSGQLGNTAEYVSQRFCRRVITGDGSLRELILWQDLLCQLETMAKAKQADWTLCLRGERGSGKTLLTAHLGRALGRNLMILEGERLADYKKETAVYFRLTESREWFFEWLVQVRLSGDLVVLRQIEDADRRLIRSFIPGLLVVLDDMAPVVAESPNRQNLYWKDTVQYELRYPDAVKKTQLWDAFLREYSHDADLNPMTLAGKYVLNAGGIRDALFAADAHARGLSKNALDMDDLIWAIRQSQAGGLAKFAQPVTCVFEWDDLVVEESVKTQMRYVCAQIQYKYKVGSEWGFFKKMPYGRGVSALFYGPPGTGKTMAAQIMAKELGYDLFRVDLSQMVSKYIGETEKNITDLFERARHMNVILFFDEADALFSKRLEVRDSHDRSANTEVAHLLQQMEAYEGILLLATNMKDNIDDAFKRRIKFMINFSLPSAEIRQKLWRSILPEETPRDPGLDLDFFAQRFELSGSQIKDVMLHAAFIAAQQQTVLSNEHIKEALIMNYQKAGKILTKSDFGYLE